MDSKIAIVKTDKYYYPKSGSFRPSVCYPEYLFKADLSEEPNHVYEMIRNGFVMMGYDADHVGTQMWNPLCGFIHPGDAVLLKPNMVMDSNRSGGGVDCLYTQPSIVAAVVDYVLIALKGRGQVIIGDAPMQECQFDRLLNESGYDRLCAYYQEKISGNVSVSIVDFRDVVSEVKHGVNHSQQKRDSGIIVDLGEESEFAGISASELKRMRITNYDPAILQQHQTVLKHEYCINRCVLTADVVINLPKPKTHRKAGVTISLKNMVGINARKEYLPHHRNGAINEGGDEYLNTSACKRLKDSLLDRRNYLMQTRKDYFRAALLRYIIQFVTIVQKIAQKDSYYEGSWYGNDTISRTIVDLNKILFYANKEGVICDTPQRAYLIIADMIIAGEKEGPVQPSPKDVGIIAIGENPVCFDEIVATIMGANRSEIHTLQHARSVKGRLKLVSKEQFAKVVSNDIRWNNKTIETLTEGSILHFNPTSGWREAFKE